MEAPARARLVLSNIGAVVASRIATIAISFVVLPVIVRSIGKDGYGLYALVMTVTGYVSVLDLGMTAALTKFVAEYRGRNDLARVDRFLNAAFTYFLAFGVVAAAGLLALAPVAERVFGLAPAMKPVADRLFLVGAASMVLLLPTNIFRTVIEAFQRYRTSALVTTLGQAATAAAILAALKLGGSVAAVFSLTNAGFLAANLALFVALRRMRPGFCLHPVAGDRETFRLMLGYGVYLFVGGVTSLVVFQLDNLIVGTFVSVSAVATYHIGFTLFAAVRSVGNLVAGPPWVHAAQLEGEHDYAAQRRLFLRGTRCVATLFLPGILVLMLFADALVLHWMGPDYRESALVARILLAAWLLVSLSETGIGMLSAKGMVRTPTLIALVTAALNLVLSLLLVRVVGPPGVALGSALAFVAVAPWVWRVILTTLGVSLGQLAREALVPAAFPLVLAAATAGLLMALLPPTSLVLTLVEMAAAYAFTAAVSFVTALPGEDRALLWSLIRVPGAASARTGERTGPA